MSNNTFGKLFSLTTAGESHGPAYTGIVDGMPAGVKIDFDLIRLELSRRRPGQKLSTARSEADEVRFLSGIMDGVTLGTPIAFMIPNTDTRPADYEEIGRAFRPSHADFTYQAKYGVRDARGGGRSSARETVLRVVAGSLAMQVLKGRGITIDAWTSRIGQVAYDEVPEEKNLSAVWDSPVRCPSAEHSLAFEKELEEVRRQGDTVGCIVTGMVRGLPAGIGEPVYNKLQAGLASAMMSINASHGFEYGDGFDMASARGSQMADPYEISDEGFVMTSTNHSGGIQGGISNGMPVMFRVAFKPLPTMMRQTESIDNRGNKVVLEPRGRHDVCAVPRVVPVVRAMAAISVLDFLIEFEGRRAFH